MFKNIYPLIPVRDMVVLPYQKIPLYVGRIKSIQALEEAISKDSIVVFSAQVKPEIEDPRESDIHTIGTLSKILQYIPSQEGYRILVEGLRKVEIVRYLKNPSFFEVEIQFFYEEEYFKIDNELRALMRNLTANFEKYLKLSRKALFDISGMLMNEENPYKVCYIIAGNMNIKLEQKQKILEIEDIKKKLYELDKILHQEIELLDIEKRIEERVRKQIEKTQREYYLSEQMKAIQKELNKGDDFVSEVQELEEKIKKCGMPEEARKQAIKELSRLKKMMPFSPEATVVRTYIDWLVSLPWNIKTKDNLDIKRAEKILEEDHYGLKKAKERVLEYLAVCKLNNKLKGPILCFVGPPGTGKTSFAKSIARALGRKFVRISLGGIRDEAEIRGHRRTYVGALPGRIIQSIRRAGTKNPVFLMDEIDKMGVDFRGDPASALLEVLDPEQNHSFSDHYLEVSFDLSDVMFITTANVTYSIPPALKDRMEIIEFSGYTIEDKIYIAKRFLIPRQKKENGLEEKKVEFTDEAIETIIKGYTLEAGVRNLEREIASILRKVAKEFALKKVREKRITAKSIRRYLGSPKFHEEEKVNEVGVATGLAWTSHGGETISVEVTVMKGKGKLTLTGQLGDVMKESATAALSYVRSNAKKFGINPDFFKDKDIHIHVPQGAIPKDGPSAGITISVALISALTGNPVKKKVAMTGEITLRGKILPVGGIREKILAAYRGGIEVVLIPKENFENLEDIPEKVKKKVKIIPISKIDEAVKKAVLFKERRRNEKSVEKGKASYSRTYASIN
ncbi:MAG: endopeptidase La [Caldiserica bacterium]|nr:MAG: endopeptidase La [Caldisericota bacterium]